MTDGIPFVMTQAIKEGLQALGYSKEEIRNITVDAAVKLLDDAGIEWRQTETQAAEIAEDLQAAVDAGMEIMTDNPGVTKQPRTTSQPKARTARHGAHPRINRFLKSITLPSEDAKRPPITYVDDLHILPRIPGGCVGLAIGQQGSHKTGLFVALGLQAIEQHGDRILYVAAEDAHGVMTDRLPAAAKARGVSFETLDAHWRTTGEDGFALLADSDRGDLVEAYKGFKPTIVFIDVLTKVAPGDINSPQVAAEIMNAAEDLAKAFGAVVVISHHPGKDESRGGMGSNLFISRTYFQWTLRHKDSVVRVTIDKLKGGISGGTLRYLVESGMRDVPVIRAMTEEEIAAHRAKQPAPPNLAAENATDDPVLEQLASDVVNVLKKIPVPTPLRDIALRMMENDPALLKQAHQRLSAKDAETLTPDEVKERCVQALIKRLKREIGDEKTPGRLAPFVLKIGNGRALKFATPYRLVPAGDLLPPSEEEIDAALLAQAAGETIH
jgi:AAA domain